MERCKALRKDGLPCNRRVLINGYCIIHFKVDKIEVD